MSKDDGKMSRKEEEDELHFLDRSLQPIEVLLEEHRHFVWHHVLIQRILIAHRFLPIEFRGLFVSETILVGLRREIIDERTLI